MNWGRGGGRGGGKGRKGRGGAERREDKTKQGRHTIIWSKKRAAPWFGFQRPRAVSSGLSGSPSAAFSNHGHFSLFYPPRRSAPCTPQSPNSTQGANSKERGQSLTTPSSKWGSMGYFFLVVCPPCQFLYTHGCKILLAHRTCGRCCWLFFESVLALPPLSPFWSHGACAEFISVSYLPLSPDLLVSSFS